MTSGLDTSNNAVTAPHSQALLGSEIDLDRLIAAVRGSRMAQVVYECRTWLRTGASASTPTLGDPVACSINADNAAKIEIIPPVSNPQ
jgi:hypothetical protein